MARPWGVGTGVAQDIKQTLVVSRTWSQDWSLRGSSRRVPPPPPCAAAARSVGATPRAVAHMPTAHAPFASCRVLGATTYIFCASAIPALAFGEQLTRETDGLLSAVQGAHCIGACGLAASRAGLEVCGSPAPYCTVNSTLTQTHATTLRLTLPAQCWRRAPSRA